MDRRRGLVKLGELCPATEKLVHKAKKLLEDLTGRLGPITAERHVAGHHHGHEGLTEKVRGGG